MTSRDMILNRVTQNKPNLLPLPELEAYPQAETNLVEKFSVMLQSVGGQAFVVENPEQAREHLIRQLQATEHTRIADFSSPGLATLDPHTLEDVFITILHGQLGVAENAAIWIPESHFPGNQRVLPFICQHLVIFLEKHTLVPTLHEAYQQLQVQSFGGYGVFIAGPSKTADIEQSLVIGAHGARSLLVYLY